MTEPTREPPEGIEYRPAEGADSPVAAFLGGAGWTPRAVAEKAKGRAPEEDEKE